MKQKPTAPVVVGIDGSASAVRAAEWAVDEAVSRDSALRLIHIIEPGSEAVRLETEYAETALRTARTAVDAIGKRVAVETIILRGHIDSMLVEESRHAEMICVGSFGVGYPTRKLLGSVAALLAESAHCPVAVVRTPNVLWPESRCIAVVVGDPYRADEVLRVAMDEARMRKASLLLLRIWPAARGSASDGRWDRRIAGWKRRYPDVDVHPVAVRTSLAEFLAETDLTVLLAIVDTTGGDAARRLVGPSAISRAYCSVIVVDPDHDRRRVAPGRTLNFSSKRDMAAK